MDQGIAVFGRNHLHEDCPKLLEGVYMNKIEQLK